MFTHTCFWSHAWNRMLVALKRLQSLFLRSSLIAKTRCFLQLSVQHPKQYQLYALLFSQFPHFTSVVLHSLMAFKSNMLTMRKLDGKSWRFPLSGTSLSLWHSGYFMISHFWWRFGQTWSLRSKPINISGSFQRLSQNLITKHYPFRQIRH